MGLLLRGIILWCSVAICFISANDSTNTNGLFRCVIRDWKGATLWDDNAPWAEPEKRPWHAVLYRKGKYHCGGTLIGAYYVLTSAGCVTDAGRKLTSSILVSVHLGMNQLDVFPEHVQIIIVSQIFVHPEFLEMNNDIALLELSKPARYSRYVIPICIEGLKQFQINALERQLSWVAFGEFAKFNISRQLQTVWIPIENVGECFYDDPPIFCAGFWNKADNALENNGNGLYIHARDHWITFYVGEIECFKKSCLMFTDVSFYHEWIQNKIKFHNRLIGLPKRISEQKCQHYSKLARRREKGSCNNARSPHTVVVIDQNQRHISGGSIISEKFVLTKAPSLSDILLLDVDWDSLWIKQPHVKVIQEIFHPEHDPERHRHDVLLLELESPLTFTSHLLPACLPYLDTENMYDSTILNGYTETLFFESVENQIISNEKCNLLIRKSHRKYTLHEEEICATDWYERPLYWSGIVGGPLQTVNSGSCMFTLVGITKDLILDDERQPEIRVTSVFLRVKYYLDWIEENVWGN